MDITRRQFTSICAASLAVPGMLPIQTKVKSFSELCNEDFYQYRRFVSDCVAYYSPVQKIHVPYEDKFIVFDTDADCFKFAWGHVQLCRIVSFYYTCTCNKCDMVVCRGSWDKTQIIDPEKEESILGKTVGYKIL